LDRGEEDRQTYNGGGLRERKDSWGKGTIDGLQGKLEFQGNKRTSAKRKKAEMGGLWRDLSEGKRGVDLHVLRVLNDSSVYNSRGGKKTAM